MKFWRSYDGITTLAWICTVVFVASITDASLTDSELAARLAYGVAAVAVVIGVLSLFLLRRMKRRAESKVSESGTILLTDIQTLAKSNSKLLEDAIALHSAQKEEGALTRRLGRSSDRDQAFSPFAGSVAPVDPACQGRSAESLAQAAGQEII